MPTAVSYSWYSSDNRREESIVAQDRAIDAYARQHGIELLHRYRDEAKSASVYATAPRPDIERMLLDVTTGCYAGVDLILFHKLDRLARNEYDLARLKH